MGVGEVGMEIFLSAEVEGKAASYWYELRKEIEPLFERMKDASYGENLTSIGIISIILKRETLEHGWETEKKYYNKKEKEADIRLKIDYDKFIKAKKEERRNLYVKHILDSIKVAGEKAKGEFDTERLLDDVKQILDVAG